MDPFERNTPPVQFVEQWLAYSEDKRTDGGWSVLRDSEIGRVDVEQTGLRFESMAEAVAEFVVRELDFWASVAEAG